MWILSSPQWWAGMFATAVPCIAVLLLTNQLVSTLSALRQRLNRPALGISLDRNEHHHDRTSDDGHTAPQTLTLMLMANALFAVASNLWDLATEPLRGASLYGLLWEIIWLIPIGMMIFAPEATLPAVASFYNWLWGFPLP